MTLQELRYLVALSEHGHFGRAATACHVSQPSLSAALKKLEEELGVQFFERRQRRVLPTAMGERLIVQARQVLREADFLEEMARETTEPLAGILRLGAIPTVGPYLMPRIVPELRKAHPRLELHLHEQQTGVLLDDLRRGRIDLALMSPPVDDHGLERVDLYRENFLLAAPQGHMLAQKKRVRTADILEEPLLLLDEGHCLRDQVLEVCRSADTPARELLRGSSLETLRSMVAAGVGCTLMPALALDPVGGAVRLEVRPFVSPAPFRIISLYWRKGYSREDTVREFEGFVRSHLPALVNKVGR